MEVVLSPYKPKDDDLRDQSTYRYLGLLLFLTWKAEAIWHGNERIQTQFWMCWDWEFLWNAICKSSSGGRWVFVLETRTSESMFKCPLKSLYVVKLPTKGKYTEEKRIEDRTLGKPWEWDDERLTGKKS